MAEFFGNLISYLLGFIVIYVAISYVISPRRSFGLITSRWQKHFDMQFSTKDFYASVWAAIKEQEVPHISMDEVAHGEDYLVIPTKRLYLQVHRGDQLILVCAAPFGNGFFVSWWSGEKLNIIKDLIPRIPTIGPALAKFMYSKTFYQMDTENAFKEVVRNCVLEVIDKITNDKGIRGLTELERMPIDTPLTNKLK